MTKAHLTPLMLQYRSLKERHPDKFLFFRLGDFYELFEEDALEAAKILQITLTQRSGIPMCGIPHHQLSNYAYKIIQAGKKIAIAEQMGESSSSEKNDGKKKSPSIVERKVTNIITPGTTIDDQNLVSKKNNYIITVNLLSPSSATPHSSSKEAGLLVAFDISTGESLVQILSGENGVLSELENFFFIHRPREMVVESSDPEDLTVVHHLAFRRQMTEKFPDLMITEVKKDRVMPFKERLDSLFHDSAWLGEMTGDVQAEVIKSLGLVISYVEENYGQSLVGLSPPVVVQRDYLRLDGQTIAQLELFENTTDHTMKFSLLSVLDDTNTSMGGRLLKEWLARPLIDSTEINQRLDKVEYFYKTPHLLEQVRSYLKKIFDVQRVLMKLKMKRVLPRELIGLKRSLQVSKDLFALLSESFIQLDLENLPPALEEMVKASELIGATLLDEPNNDFKEGGVIRPEVDDKLGEYHKIKRDGEQLLLSLEQTEKQKTNIPSLKVKFTENMGYFFEVRKSSSQLVPNYFKRRQSLSQVDRFVSEDLMALEQKILAARIHSNDLEKQFFEKLKDRLTFSVEAILVVASEVAKLDVLVTFAKLALSHRYVRPSFNSENKIEIKKGRHPVVEVHLDNFTANDINIGGEDNLIHLITGPNMAGKSTFLRQVGLISLLAQLGAYVPAERANLSICDQLFTRIGSSDKLAQGESTFFVEMNETANILKNATAKSLIIMDEIGRGTSTYDGLSIAWSILEYINTSVKAKTLFATHYHELVQLERERGIVSFKVTVKEEEGELLFLKKVQPGVIERSYGVHVAEIAGVPKEVISRAKILLSSLEAKSSTENMGKIKQSTNLQNFKTTNNMEDSRQIRDCQTLKQKITSYKLDEMTPLEALTALNELCDLLEKFKR